MFIRINKTPNSPRKSIQIVESIRIGRQVKQKIIQHVGVASDESQEQKLKDYAQELIAQIQAKRLNEAQQTSLTRVSDKEIFTCLKTKRGRKKRKRLEEVIPPSEVTLTDIIEKERIIEGIHEVGNVVYEMLGYHTFLQKRDDKILRDLVLTRLAHPASKRQSCQRLSQQFGREHLLDSMYRLMDKLYDKIPDIKRCTFERMKSLFPQNVDLVLFDVTTLYLESTQKDELRNFGYSKDCRFNTTQVVLALATNQDGLPVGYELFEGNQAEVKTLAIAIEHWKTFLGIGQVCFIGDRAMFTKENLKILDEHRYQYVVAAKLRSLSDEMQNKILDEKHYHPIVLSEELAWINEQEYDGKRLIISYKLSRAHNDQKEREQILNKIKKVIGTRGSTRKLISNHGIKKFTHTDESSKTQIDDNRVAADALWDGLHGVITNIEHERPESIIARYARLWIIEESFRINKHLLKMRPIFHWKPKRIHAHIAICYMAFAVLRHLQYRVTLTQKLSPEMIVEELVGVQSSIYIHKRTQDLYRVPGKFTNEARKIYKAFDIIRSEDATVHIT